MTNPQSGEETKEKLIIFLDDDTLYDDFEVNDLFTDNLSMGLSY